MARVITTENPSQDVRRYLRHWAASDFTEDRLHGKHPMLGADRRRTKAQQIAVLVEQGIEFIGSSEQSSPLTKPLALYYAAENLSKAVCIYRDAAKDMTDFGHHGLNGDRSTRYFVRNLRCKVSSRRDGVWPQLFALFNGDRIRFSATEDGSSFLRDRRETYATRPLAAGTLLVLGDLLRHIPELAEDVILAGWGHPFVVHAPTLAFTTRSGPPPEHTGRMVLRHGHRAEARAMVKDRERDLLRDWQCTYDALDVLVYEHRSTQRTLTFPNGRLDAFGELYLDFARGTRVFGELILYFGSLFILSDVVRYQADQWLRLLKDHPAEAILIDRFLDIAVRKLPNLVLNELHEELLLFRFAH